MVKTGFGLDAASAGAFNPGYTPNMLEHYNHMNTVSTQCLSVDWWSLTYLVAL